MTRYRRWRLKTYCSCNFPITRRTAIRIAAIRNVLKNTLLEIDGEKQPVHMENENKYTRHLERDLHYERKSKVRWQIIFLVLVSLNILLLLLDIFRPDAGSIRYQQQMACCAGKTAWEMLGRILRTARRLGGI